MTNHWGTDLSSPLCLPVIHSVRSADKQARVEYCFSGDRFVQRVFINDIEVARSVDGDSRQPWPASPPVQEISLESINGMPTILGVGAAGQSHWSISVAALTDPDLPYASTAIRFDIACRTKSLDGFLGSTYRLLGGGSVDDLPCEHRPAVAIEPVLGRENRKGQQLVFEPPMAPPSQSSTVTHRWVYDLLVGTAIDQ